MNYKIARFCTALALTALINFSSCSVKETETFSHYFIDNESQYDLMYHGGDIHTPMFLGIDTGELVEIERTNELGTEGVHPDQFYQAIANNLGDIYLYRDSSGLGIEALRLSTLGQLNWVETLRGPNGDGNLLDYTLMVTDSMISH